MSISDKKAAAIAYAGLGYPVFPVEPNGKAPLTELAPRGFKSATTDVATVENWWSEYPDANIGLATAGLIVIDVDGDDNEWLSDPEKMEQLSTAKAVALTPSGGRHFFFKKPNDKKWRNTTSDLALKVDTKTCGGYVVVSPSVGEIGAYKWADTFELTDNRENLSTPPMVLSTMLDNSCNGKQHTQAATVKDESDSIPNGKRNTTLVSIAGWDRASGKSYDEILASLLVTNENRCNPPLPTTEVERIVKNVCKYDRNDIVAAVREGKVKNPDFKPFTLGKTMSNVQPENIKWLWPGVIPFGKMTLISGDPGVGKSFMTMDIAARASAGKPWPGDSNRPTDPINVIILNCEDGLTDTIRPRLDEAGADVTKIRAITGVQRTQGGEVGFFTLDQDMKALERDVINFDARLVIIDPISGFLGGSDSHSNAEIRGLLTPLADIAERRGCAVIMINHLNKAGTGRAIYRSMGSIAFPGASRISWMVTRDQNDIRKRLMLLQKVNIVEDPQGYAFTIDDGRIAWSNERPTIDLDDALNYDPSSRSKREKAATWLKQRLLTGSMTVNEIKRAADAEGYSWTTVTRAKKDLGLSSSKHGFGKGAYSEWKHKTE